MNSKTLLAALVGGVAHFLLGWLIYGMALMSYMNSMLTPEGAAVTRAEPIIWGYAVGSLAWAFLLAWLYSCWAAITTFNGGMMAGAVIGALMALSVDMNMYAAMNAWTGLNGLFVDLAANAVISGLVGGVVGWMLGRGAAK